MQMLLIGGSRRLDAKVTASIFAFSSLPRGLINQEIIELLSTFDCSNKPTRSCTTACPGFT